MNKINALGRLLVICLAALMVFSAMTVGAPKNKVLAANDDEILATKGDYIGIQFKTNTAIDSIGFYASKSGSGKTGTVEVYTWNKNISKTYESEPIFTGEVSGWSSKGPVAAYFTEPLQPGEYVLKLTITKGVNLAFALADSYNKTNAYFETGLYQDKSFRVFVNDSESLDALDNCSAPVFDDNGIDPTQWVAVDGLGRTVPSNSEVGDKNDKLVGIFYWTWHESNDAGKACNVNNIILENPDAKNDYKHAIWKKNNVGSYFWDEPIYGYYIESDDYVLRKHAELLADAGVDFVLFDCTNGTFTWEDQYMNLLKVWSQAKNEGVNVPKIAFMLPFWDQEYNRVQMVQIYNKLYKNGLYQDMWFYWEGKPLIMGLKSALKKSEPVQKEILDFFTFRRGEPSYWEGDQSDDNWGWLHVYPQAVYTNDDGSVEQITVGVAQNANYKTMQLDAMNGSAIMGRAFSMQKDYSYSFQYRNKTVTVNSESEDAMLYGINFQEQWDYAISRDPEIIFVTGWNEWIMGRFETWQATANAFPDQFNDPYSRDCEPTKGVLKDYYYYQLAENIRRFKGASQSSVQTVAKSIDVSAGADQWNDEGIVAYNHYTRNTYDRYVKKSWGNKYENYTMRNDIVTSKVLYDDDNIYFYVETAEDLTPYTDENWMRLLIDTGAATEDSKDWEEFEYILNRVNPTADAMTLEKSTGGWNWETVGTVSYSIQGNVLQAAIPKAMLGITSDKPCFNFKWCDNNLTDGDIMTLYTDGDAAPGARFAFAFVSDAEYIKPAEPEETTGETSAKSGSNLMLIASICALAAAAAVLVSVLVLTKGKK